MIQPARLDLERFRIDSESHLAQAMALGLRFGTLREDYADGMLAYLRTVGMGHAQRYREGIGITREVLERGVRQAVVCMELGLLDVSAGDLNAAVDGLAAGDLETLRKRGWELAFFRLEEMRDRSLALLGQPETAFLKGRLKDLRRWSRLTPETWTWADDEADAGEDNSIDPLRDYASFREVKGRMDFVAGLPSDAREDLLLAAGEDVSYDGLLRNLVLSLALDLQVLVPDAGQVSEFESRCFAEGKLLPEARERVLAQTEAFLVGAVEDEAVREVLLSEIRAEISQLESRVDRGLAGFFTVLEEGET